MCQPWLGRQPFSPVLFAISNQLSGFVPIIMILIIVIMVAVTIAVIIMIMIVINFP